MSILQKRLKKRSQNRLQKPWVRLPRQRIAPSGSPLPRQGGQAVAECLVLCLALIPLFLLTPVIAKYQDIAHATQLSSRYVALDAMTRDGAAGSWKPEAQLAGEVRRRFFGTAGAPVKTGDTAGDFAAHQNLFWRDPAGAPLIRKFDNDIAVSFGHGGSATHGGAFHIAADGKPYEALAVSRVSDALRVRPSGIYTVNVGVTLANLPAGLRNLEPFDGLNLSLRRHTSVVTEPWTARDPASVEGRISDPFIFPGKLAAKIGSQADTAVLAFEVGQLAQPQPAVLSLWRDVVPGDRRIAP